MDHRQPLEKGTILSLDGLACRIEGEIGRGSNAIVYKGWYYDGLNADQKHIVLIKELFPLHPGKWILRNEDGLIQVAPGAEDFYNVHRSSFEKGNEIHLRLLREKPNILGANLNSYRENGTYYSVLGYTGGRSLQEELDRSSLRSLRDMADVMMGLLDALEAFHTCGYLHLDISPDNIMLMGDKRTRQVFLIDYNSAKKMDSDDSCIVSYKQGYSSPEVENHFSGIGAPADLYSVAAVFFRGIMGRELQLTESIGSKVPAVSASPWLADVPQSVLEMVFRILRKGLHTLPQRRYQTVDQMRQAFQELLDRIDCVGVTHWSLWENGKRSVDELIRINPSLRYLREESKLYPIRLEQESSMPLAEYLDSVVSPGGHSGLILAQGGMGKTTLMLHTAMLQGKRYSPTAPAIFYISLNGWNGADTHYIRNQILMRLRFKREENTFDGAMHALCQLLRQAIKTKGGEVPTALLLLDGLNEIRDDMGPLIQEIHELNTMAGVRMIAASRSEIPALELKTARLMPLNEEDIEAALGRNGLLIPQNPEVLHLLQTPLILSIYIQASEGGKQLEIQSEEELMNAYLAALLDKEIRQLPEDSPQRWQTDAALNYVLPAIAAEIKRRDGALTEQQMLSVVESCWKVLCSHTMRKAFPQWIGHSRDIRSDAQTPEEWYGIIIHSLLWQRLGMLMKDSSGRYRVFHQVVEDYLANVSIPASNRRGKLLSIGLFLLCAVLLIGYPQYRAEVQRKEAEQQASIQQLETDKCMKTAIELAAAGYAEYGNLYRQIRKLTDYALNGDLRGFQTVYNQVLGALQEAGEVTPSERTEEQQMERSAVYDQVRVSWSSSEFVYDYTLLSKLQQYPDARATIYGNILPVFKTWMETDSLQEKVPAFATAFSELLEADAYLVSEMYHRAAGVHLSGPDTVWQENINALIAMVPEQDAHRDTTVREDRGQLLNSLQTAFIDAESQFETEFAKINAYIRN